MALNIKDKPPEADTTKHLEINRKTPPEDKAAHKHYLSIRQTKSNNPSQRVITNI